jgi:hypothetical protein
MTNLWVKVFEILYTIIFGEELLTINGDNTLFIIMSFAEDYGFGFAYIQ